MTRIMDRDGRSKEEAQRRVASQLSNAGERKTINRELIHLTFKCRKGFAGEHCALHSLAARGDPEAGGRGSEEVTGGDQLQLVELCFSGAQSGDCGL